VATSRPRAQMPFKCESWLPLWKSACLFHGPFLPFLAGRVMAMAILVFVVTELWPGSAVHAAGRTRFAVDAMTVSVSVTTHLTFLLREPS
jgi:hypothetical protein